MLLYINSTEKPSSFFIIDRSGTLDNLKEESMDELKIGVAYKLKLI